MKIYPNHQKEYASSLNDVVSFLSRQQKTLPIANQVKTIDKLTHALYETKFCLTKTLFKAVVLSLIHCQRIIEEDMYVLQFHPFVAAFLRHARKPGRMEAIQRYVELNSANSIDLYNRNHPPFVDINTLVLDFIADLKYSMGHPVFKKMVYNAVRSSQNNFLDLCEYQNWLFECHARLLVIRVDLGYRKGNTIDYEQDRYAKYWEIAKDRDRLFEKMETLVRFKDIVGYVWKLEYGPEKGFHLHLLAFLNGSLVRKDQSLAHVIGDYWSGDHTQGRGMVHPCNDEKDDFDTLGIGMINYYDQELRAGLLKAAGYLTKVDYLARGLVPEGFRTFGKCEKLLDSGANKMGRKRSYEV